MADSATEDRHLGTLPGGSHVLAASVDTGRRLMTTLDDNLRHQSRFDREARKKPWIEGAQVTLEEYLEYIATQIRPWTDGEVEKLGKIVPSIAGKLERLHFPLPDTLYLVKTSGNLQGQAAYTRLLNVVALPVNMVASLEKGIPNFGDPLHPPDYYTYLENVITHELFHIFSKNNPVRRGALYSQLSYQLTGNNVELPDVPWPPGSTESRLPELKITNPDTPELDVFIALDVPPTPGGHGEAQTTPLLPVLLADKPYAGGNFFKYLQWWFMAVEQADDGSWVATLDDHGQPLLYESKPLLPQYYDIVGRNFTNETFHPDEILAQSFVLCANQPSMALLAQIEATLRD